MIINIQHLKNKIIYRSNYRGTKEMDKLLGSFTKRYIDQLNEDELSLLCDLLNYDDENLGDQWEMIGLLEWIGTDNHNTSEALRLGREIFDTEGYASMKDVDSSEQKRQSIKFVR